MGKQGSAEITVFAPADHIPGLISGLGHSQMSCTIRDILRF